MLRLSYDEYDQAVEKMAGALQTAEDAQMRTMAGRAMVMLEALGGDFDVSVMDPGPPDDLCQNPTHDDHRFAMAAECMSWTDRDDIESGNVFGCVHCSSEDHETTDHDAALLERIVNETAQYNRDVFGAR